MPPAVGIDPGIAALGMRRTASATFSAPATRPAPTSVFTRTTASVPFAYQAHFNPAAFRRPLPSGSIGNLGNAPVGVLRHPSWWNHDFTLARRFPIRGGANLRVQLQMYNVFNLVEFTQMNASYTFSASGNTAANTGKYTSVNNPFNGGVTFRLDF